MNPQVTRREFIAQSFGTECSYFFLETLFARELFARPIQPVISHWAQELNTICQDLRTHSLTLVQWQERIEALLNRVELAEMLRFIDFDQLTRQFAFPDLGVNTKPVAFPKLEGLPQNLAFHKKVFGVKKARAIIPRFITARLRVHIRGDHDRPRSELWQIV